MPPRITDSQRKAVLALLAQGLARETVAAQVGVTPGQVSAVAAHRKMGTYEKHGAHATVAQSTQPERRERVPSLDATLFLTCARRPLERASISNRRE
jgi:DNA-binding NarL/FixJ family response regulator